MCEFAIKDGKNWVCPDNPLLKSTRKCDVWCKDFVKQQACGNSSNEGRSQSIISRGLSAHMGMNRGLGTKFGGHGNILVTHGRVDGSPDKH